MFTLSDTLETVQRRAFISALWSCGTSLIRWLLSRDRSIRKDAVIIFPYDPQLKVPWKDNPAPVATPRAIGEAAACVEETGGSRPYGEVDKYIDIRGMDHHNMYLNFEIKLYRLLANWFNQDKRI